MNHSLSRPSDTVAEHGPAKQEDQRFLKGCRLLEGSVRPVLVVVSLVLAKDPERMSLVPDHCLVEQFASAAADPAFDDRVRAGRSDGTAQDPDPRAGEDRVEGSGELGVAIAEQERDSGDVLVEVHEQVRAIWDTHASLG
jgi:hypothetical protein